MKIIGIIFYTLLNRKIKKELLRNIGKQIYTLKIKKDSAVYFRQWRALFTYYHQFTRS